jgi:dTDP-4-dehydrorhamnose reductase
VRILIVGGSGLLGRELVSRCVAAGHEVCATYVTRRGGESGARWTAVDVRSRGDVAAAFDAFRPELTINAAYRQADWAVTADGAAHVALAAARQGGGRLVHVSSDVVFAGRADPYDETCPPGPVSPYGAAKAAAETAVRAIAPESVIARTSLIVGGASPSETLVRELAAGRREGVLFTDDVRCPVHVTDLAAALVELGLSGHRGIRHVAGPDAVTRYELGLLIAHRDGLNPSLLRPGRRTGTDLLGPLEVRLDSTATQKTLQTRLRGAREFLTPPPRPTTPQPPSTTPATP